MYRNNYNKHAGISRNETTKGDHLELQIKRMQENQEPIDNEKPLVYTPKKEGVLPSTNYRTDRWEIAAEAMDVITKSKNAKTEAGYKLRNGIKDDEVEPTGGTE